MRDRVRLVAIWDVLLAGCGSRQHAYVVDGKAIDPFQERAITALVFVSSECPLSNHYAPSLKRITGERAARRSVPRPFPE